MALTFSAGLAPGASAPDFSLQDVSGHTYRLADFDEASVLVVVFTCNHCPYAKAYERRLVGLQRDYAERGVQLVAINPNVCTHPEDGLAQMRERAASQGFNFPYLADETQAVSRAYDARCTPDVMVFDRARQFVCNSRIDDAWDAPERVSQQDLRQILEALLSAESDRAKAALPATITPSKGCSIKWLKDAGV